MIAKRQRNEMELIDDRAISILLGGVRKARRRQKIEWCVNCETYFPIDQSYLSPFCPDCREQAEAEMSAVIDERRAGRSDGRQECLECGQIYHPLGTGTAYCRVCMDKALLEMGPMIDEAEAEKDLEWDKKRAMQEL